MIINIFTSFFPIYNQNHPDPHIVVVGVPHRPTRGMPLRLLAAGQVEDYYTFTYLKLITCYTLIQI